MRKLMKNSLNIAMAAALTLSMSPAAANAEASIPKTSSSKGELISKLGLSQKDKAEASLFQKGAREEFDSQTLVIKYSRTISASEHSKAGGRLIQRVTGLNYDVIQVKSGNKLEDAAKEYAKIPGVLSVSRSAKIQRSGSPDLKAGEMYHLNTLKADEAQKLAGKNKVKVAVIDGGVDAGHPELKNKIAGNFNTMDPIKKGAPDAHGTHVAGIIAAEKNNGIGGYGVNPNASILAIDVFNRSFFASDYTIAQGILKAIEQKAQVINMSLGSSYRSPIIEDAVKKALDANITIVAAAGNSGVNALQYPAAFEGVISVGSTNSKNELSSYSTFGPSVDVVAPGEAVYSSIYDIEKGSSFGKLSGTSMSTPAVAGVVSLLLSKNPKLTPYEITYILQNTGIDLGAEGYDVKFGHGLVNPSAALKFDTKKIPKNPAVPEKDLIRSAKPLDALTSITLNGSITKLNQTDSFKTSVKKGDLIQANLDVSKNYDYQLEFRFYSEGETESSDQETINDQAEGLSDGALYEAPENGTVVISVKDANGNYSKTNLSKYTLKLDKADKKAEDSNTEENPVKISGLPFTSDPHYYTDEQEELIPEEEMAAEDEAVEEGPSEDGSSEEPADAEESEEGGEPAFEEKGDSDYFSLSYTDVKEGEVAKISLSGVAGINPSIKLHIIEEVEGEKGQYELDMADQYGFGKGEELIFTPVPNAEYVVEVTNKPVFDPFFFLFFGEMEIDLTRNFSSQIPYTVSIESKVLPLDEDGFPMGEMIPEEALEEGNIEEFYKRKNAMIERMDEHEEFIEEDYPSMIMEAARPYEARQVANGYFQYNGDEDWFAFTPEEDAIYEFNFVGGSKNLLPVMEIYQFNEEAMDFSYVSSNVKVTDSGFGPSAAFRVGLKSGQTYYMNTVDMNYRASDKPYRFSSKAILKNISDEFEYNDKYEVATPLDTQPVAGNFSSAADLDMFYFTPSKNGLYGYVASPVTEQPRSARKVPGELFAPIDPVVVAIEDTNKNQVLDPEEEGKFIFTDYGFENDEERGSLEAKADKGYFIVTFNYYSSVSSLMPYQLQMVRADRADEDKGSVVKNNVPSKPALLKQSKGTYSADAYFNASNGKGDADYFKLTVEKQGKKLLSLKTPSDADGVITLYDSKGKQLASTDYYGLNDVEYMPLNLKKGTYFIKIEEAADRASVSPYQLRIK